MNISKRKDQIYIPINDFTRPFLLETISRPLFRQLFNAIALTRLQIKNDLLTFGYGSGRFLSGSGSNLLSYRLDPDPRPWLWIRIGSVFNDFVHRLVIWIPDPGDGIPDGIQVQ
jgi:hypothetical protein